MISERQTLGPEVIREAFARISNHVTQTRVLRCAHHSAMIGGQVFLKLEQEQVSGSFKARGAFNKILSIPESERNAFFIAASTGNHAAAFCHVLQTLGLRGKVVLPQSVSSAKLDFIRSYPIEVELFGKTSLQAEMHTRALAQQHGYILVHPYDDAEIIAGQGTIAIELLEQVPQLDTVLIPVGGGGLASGIASYLKTVKPTIRIIGCQPENSPEMVRSIELGRVIQEDISRPTLSDGTAGGMESDSITYPLCRDLVDDWILISEEEIAAKLRWMIEYHNILVEGAAGLSLAAVQRLNHELRGQTVACIICGKRIGAEKLKRILCE